MPVDSEFKPGQKWRYHYGENNRANKVIHIRSIVDKNIVIYRHWSYRYQSWSYTAIADYLLDIYVRQGVLIRASRQRA